MPSKHRRLDAYIVFYKKTIKLFSGYFWVGVIAYRMY